MNIVILHLYSNLNLLNVKIFQEILSLFLDLYTSSYCIL